jgi:hypothetical protein
MFRTAIADQCCSIGTHFLGVEHGGDGAIALACLAELNDTVDYRSLLADAFTRLRGLPLIA